MSSQIVEVKLTASLLSRAMQSKKRNVEANGVVDLEQDALVVAGEVECMRKDEGLRGLQRVADVVRKEMCIITGNTVLLYAHLRVEGRRY